MRQLTGRKRLLLGGVATAAVALGIGGVAYAAGDTPAPEQGYVTIEDSPGTTGATATDRDCPEKDGTGGSAAPESSDPQGQA